MDKLQTFFENIEQNREFTGDVKETVLNGKAEIRASVYEDEVEGHRNGTIEILLQTDEDPEEILSTAQLARMRDVDLEIKRIETQLMELIDEHCGYNPYEPLFDIAEEKFDEGEFDIVAHDSFVVFDEKKH